MAGTNGDASIDRSTGHHRRIAHAVTVATLFVLAAINANTATHNAAAAGRTLDWREPWLGELSSVTFWVLMLPVFGWLAVRLRPPWSRWHWAVLAHAALTLPISAAHNLTNFGLRRLVCAVTGLRHGHGFDALLLLHGYRKDVLAYALLVAATGFIEQRRQPAPDRNDEGAPGGAAPADGFRLEVRDRGRTQWLTPTDIDWVEAAGNYVQLNTRHGAILHRSTLVGIARLLCGHGFVRVHRSRLVRLACVRGIASTASGDFELRLENGERILGSRRFRSNLRLASTLR
jgi:hypothetical protein